MGDLKLTGNLNLSGTLDLNPSGKLMIGPVEALVEGASGTGAPVPLPPPSPADVGTAVEVKKSFNATIKANGKALVTQGVTMQGDIPSWPGMVQAGTGTVRANQIPINVANEPTMTLPTGAPVPLTTSGQ